MLTKNILFLAISLNKGGAERVISILLKHLTSHQNVKVYLILMEDGIAYDLPENIKPIILSKSKKSGMRKLLELPFIAYQIAKFTKEYKIDTIMSFLYRPNYINILTKFFGFKGKSIINIRSTTSRYLNEGLLGKINLFLIKNLFNKANLIISNSIGVKEDLNTLVTIDTKHIAIPNPIDITKIEALTNSKQGINQELDASIDYIISVGRLIPLKRNKDLLLAFSKIYKQLDNTKLLFVGEGVLKEDLIQYSKELNIQDKVIFLGNVDNPFYYLKKSMLFVMTSELEGFPNVLIEAMACGLPVVSSNCTSGPKEILGDEEYGLLYEVGDIESLCKKILMVMTTKKMQISLREKSLKRVSDYSLDKIIPQFEREVLNNET
jgi:N-acetylgalactosamine-N,N'-diacetylbacillosaminyl-diphospho-undecaprenol 4-alpha-N-acetylgalactosaminyltransferase